MDIDQNNDEEGLSPEMIESFVQSWKENGQAIMWNYPISLGDIRQLIRNMPAKIVNNMVAAVKMRIFESDSINGPIVTAILNGMVLGAAIIVKDMTEDKPISDMPRED